MRIALAYNVKPVARREILAARLELCPDEEEEPPLLVTGAGAGEDVYAEWDDASTILAIAEALSLHHRVTLVEADSRLPGRMARLRPDLVFNVAEGLEGPSREAQVPSVLDMLGIPYTGSDALTLGLCLHKAWANTVLRSYGVPTPQHAIVTDTRCLNGPVSVALPAIVKPLHEGSSKGIRDDQVVESQAALVDRAARLLIRYSQPVIVEQFLPGREFTVAVLGNEHDLQVLPPIELRFDCLPAGASPIYSWEAKWLWDRPDAPLDVFECPASLSPRDYAVLERTCRATAHVLRIRDWARIDLRMDGSGILHVIEVNPLPGMIPDPLAHSCYPKAARAAGLEYADAVRAVADSACRRVGLVS